MATTLVSLEEYQNTSYEPDREYVDGVLVERNVGTQLHGLLQALITGYLLRFRVSHRLRVFTESRLLINAATGRHRIPDVMVVETPFARGKVVTDVPAVVIEVKSPTDTLDEIFEKCLEYAALNIPNIVVVDPDHQRQYLFSHQALQLVSSITLRLPKAGVDLPLPVADMFAELDEDS